MFGHWYSEDHLSFCLVGDVSLKSLWEQSCSGSKPLFQKDVNVGTTTQRQLLSLAKLGWVLASMGCTFF